MSFDYSRSSRSGSDMIIRSSNSSVRQQTENPRWFSLRDGISWKTAAKVVVAAGIGLIGICFLDDLFSGRIITNRFISQKKTDLNSYDATFLEFSKNEPCVINIKPNEYNLDGFCTKEERKKSLEDYKELMLEYNANRKKEIRKEVDEEIRKSNEKIEAFLAQNAEDFRRINHPTAEERDEDLEIINQRLDERYKGFAGYVPRSNQAPKPEAVPCDAKCQELARNILKVNSDADCRDIQRQYRKLSLETHPDKPFGNKDKFREVANAYAGLCP